MRSGLDLRFRLRRLKWWVGAVVCRVIGHQVRPLSPTHSRHCVRCWTCQWCGEDVPKDLGAQLMWAEDILTFYGFPVSAGAVSQAKMRLREGGLIP